MRPFVVGLAGGTGSGKSTLAAQLAVELGPERVSVIPHDAYYRDQAARPHDARARRNYDHPDALETTLLVDHLNALRGGRAIDRPAYDFARHARLPNPVRVEPRPVVLIEGMLLLCDTELRRALDLRVFVHASRWRRLGRRLNRDVRERGRSARSVLVQYARTVAPMHRTFVDPSRRFADLEVDGSRRSSLTTSIAVLAERIAAGGGC